MKTSVKTILVLAIFTIKLTQNQVQYNIEINMPSQAEIYVEWCGKGLCSIQI